MSSGQSSTTRIVAKWAAVCIEASRYSWGRCEQVSRHLSRTSGPASLLDVRAQPFSDTIVVGAIAASATTGALLAMGHRAGRALMPFAAIGAIPFQRTDIGSAGLVFAGALLHLVGRFGWGAVCG